MAETLEGKIIKGIGGFYYVDTKTHGLFECRARGLFRNQKIKPLVGDMAVLETEDLDTHTGYLVKIQPRQNRLIRPAAANIDQAVVIFAAAQPAPNFNLLDRFTVMMEKAGIDVVLCFNKCDLIDEKEKEYIDSIYRASRFPRCFVSAKEQAGLEELGSLFAEKTTILAGPSGVGKSTIVNWFVPDAHMQTGQISRKIERGRHTTRHSELFVLGEHSYLLDTPGFSTFYLEDIEPNELRFYFPEFFRQEGFCRFQGCLHLREPGCKVKEMLETGEVSGERYRNYELLYEELKNQKKW